MQATFDSMRQNVNHFPEILGLTGLFGFHLLRPFRHLLCATYGFVVPAKYQYSHSQFSLLRCGLLTGYGWVTSAQPGLQSGWPGTLAAKSHPHSASRVGMLGIRGSWRDRMSIQVGMAFEARIAALRWKLFLAHFSDMEKVPLTTTSTTTSLLRGQGWDAGSSAPAERAAPLPNPLPTNALLPLHIRLFRFTALVVVLVVSLVVLSAVVLRAPPPPVTVALTARSKFASECEFFYIHANNRIQHMIPVVEESRMKGMVSIGDLVRAVVGEHREELQRLNSYIQGGY